MKKVLFLAVVLAISFSFYACGPSPQEAAPTPAPTPAPSQAPPPTPVPLPAPPIPPPSPEPEPTPTPSPSPEPEPAPAPEPEPTPEEVELKYDDGEARDYISALPNGGYIVDFSPPQTPFTIKEVRLFGLVAPDWTRDNFEVEIWDKGYKVLHSAAYPVTRFPDGTPGGWVEVEVPDIEITDKFFVHVYTGTGRGEGIHLGADDSVANLHSGITLRTEEGITRIGFSGWMRASGKWFEDRSNVNWMVRVVGSFDASTPSPKVPPAPEIKPVVQIDTAHKTERELATKNTLEKLLAEYDVSKWIFTKSVVIEEGAIPHAGSRVITLSTAYLSYDYLHLSTFIHEQLEMFFSTKTNKVNQAITELRALYPTVPTDSTGFQSDRTKQGTYKHLVLCFLEFSAIKELVNEETARLSMEKMGHYIWVYETVLSDADKIEEIAQKYGLIIE